MRIVYALFAFLVLSATPVAAQMTGPCPTSMAVTINPSGDICITVASDYDTVDPIPGLPTGRPRVVGLTLLLFGPTVTDTATQGATLTIPLGHPNVNAQGAVWVNRSELLTLPLGQLYKGRVIAVGQNDSNGQPLVSARSPEGNPFGRSGPPTVPLAPARISVPE